MSAHTPGPWRVWETDGSHWWVCETEARGRHSHFAQISVGNFWPDGYANARLIAAAPDLLAALVSVLEWIDNWSPQFVEDDEWAADEESAKAAIAKARGE